MKDRIACLIVTILFATVPLVLAQERGHSGSTRANQWNSLEKTLREHICGRIRERVYIGEQTQAQYDDLCNEFLNDLVTVRTRNAEAQRVEKFYRDLAQRLKGEQSEKLADARLRYSRGYMKHIAELGRFQLELDLTEQQREQYETLLDNLTVTLREADCGGDEVIELVDDLIHAVWTCNIERVKDLIECGETTRTNTHRKVVDFLNAARDTLLEPQQKEAAQRKIESYSRWAEDEKRRYDERWKVMSQRVLCDLDNEREICFVLLTDEQRRALGDFVVQQSIQRRKQGDKQPKSPMELVSHISAFRTRLLSFCNEEQAEAFEKRLLDKRCVREALYRSRKLLMVDGFLGQFGEYSEPFDELQSEMMGRASSAHNKERAARVVSDTCTQLRELLSESQEEAFDQWLADHAESDWGARLQQVRQASYSEATIETSP